MPGTLAPMPASPHRATTMSVPPSHPGRELAPGLVVRGIEPPLALSSFKLAAFDMDSTLISIECIDEIADVVGRGAAVAAITEAAMRGEITDFRESLRQRLALLQGVPLSVLDRVYRQRLKLNPGALELLAALKAAGLKLLLVSGGFTYFTERLQPRLGLDFARANELEVQRGQLTGRVVGDVVDAEAKADTVLQVCRQIGCEPAQALAVGDGANDLEMMKIAGLSVAYRAKPKVRAQAHVSIDSGGLDRLLEVLPPMT
jgi:phosphoserine phosphatase